MPVAPHHTSLQGRAVLLGSATIGGYLIVERRKASSATRQDSPACCLLASTPRSHERRTRASNCRATPQSVNCWRCSLPRSRATAGSSSWGPAAVSASRGSRTVSKAAPTSRSSRSSPAPEAIAVARSGDWPSFVSIVEGDAVTVLPTVGEFDLVFADAEGGKWERLDLTLAAVRLHGVLIVDDMTTGALGERAASLQDSRGEGSPAVRCPVRERRDHAGRGRDRVDADSFVELARSARSVEDASKPRDTRRSCNRICFGRNSRPE